VGDHVEVLISSKYEKLKMENRLLKHFDTNIKKEGKFKEKEK